METALPDVVGEPVVPGARFQIAEVLIEFEVPLSFTADFPGLGQVLVHYADVCYHTDGKVKLDRYLIVPASDDQIAKLKAHELDMHAALMVPTALIVDCTFDEGTAIVNAGWKVSPEERERLNIVPLPGVMLTLEYGEGL